MPRDKTTQVVLTFIPQAAQEYSAELRARDEALAAAAAEAEAARQDMGVSAAGAAAVG